MGDRTYVEIKVRNSDYAMLLKKDFDNDENKFIKEFGAEGIDQLPGSSLVTIYDSEVNYAEWEDLQKYLSDNKIEFDKNWQAGGDYAAGEANYRLIDNEITSIEVYETQEELLDFLTKAVKILNSKKLEGNKKKEIFEMIQTEYKKIMPFKVSNLNTPQSVRFIKEE